MELEDSENISTDKNITMYTYPPYLSYPSCELTFKRKAGEPAAGCLPARTEDALGPGDGEGDEHPTEYPAGPDSLARGSH